MSEFLLEIGAENIPASYVPPAVEQLHDDATALLTELRLAHGEVYVTGTPRRLVLIVSDLADRQESVHETITGPPLSRAFDEHGQPTKAAEGFARSHGISVNKLATVTTGKGEMLGFTRRVRSHSAAAVLKERLPELIGGLRFPKTMKWEVSGARFARPVRWIVCLLGDRVVRFRFADVTSGRVSFGRPWIKGERATVRSAGAYQAVMHKLGIIVDSDARRTKIVQLARREADKSGLKLIDDPGLVEELNFMVEDPRVLLGEFDDNYLTLPPEVVTTAMKSHQRYLAVNDTEDRLVSRFITFTDGPPSGPAVVRRGNEKVLKARLEDAMFYWREDLKRGVDGLAEELERIVFIEGLGTLGQKSGRIRKLAGVVNDQFDQAERASKEQIARAAHIAKADLASEMIKDGKEFTLLQGLIGSHYAGAEDPAVKQSVREQYLPRTSSDPIPASVLGTLLGIADRVDTICGCFLAGFKPSGSQDPYALRRQANGLIRMVEKRSAVALDRLIDAGLSLYSEDGLADSEAARRAHAELTQFFIGRCESFLKEQGVEYDVVGAVTQVAWMWPGVALERGREIARLRGDRVFERLITGVKRVGNILPDDKRRYGLDWELIGPPFNDGGNGAFSEDLFEDPAEKRLAAALRSAIPSMTQHEREQTFNGVLSDLSSLADPIDQYFDAVMVNCDDARIRENRINFLAAIFAVFARYADFSFIVERGDHESS